MAGSTKTTDVRENRSEPRWAAALAMLAAAAMPFALPRSLNLLPQWIVATVVTLLLVAAVVTHYVHQPRLNELFGYSVLIVLTIAQFYSLVTLIVALPRHA